MKKVTYLYQGGELLAILGALEISQRIEGDRVVFTFRQPILWKRKKPMTIEEILTKFKTLKERKTPQIEQDEPGLKIEGWHWQLVFYADGSGHISCEVFRGEPVCVFYLEFTSPEDLVAKLDADPCFKCGQTDQSQTGEQPCPACGRLTLWDEEEGKA